MADEKYINLEDAVDEFQEWLSGAQYWNVSGDDAEKILRSIPAADVKPVVHARWGDTSVYTVKGKIDMVQSEFCPNCKKYHTTPYSYYVEHHKFCPNCGADMREVDDGNNT